jgi:hypothetical protein
MQTTWGSHVKKDKDYKKVLDILQENFGWSNTKDMSYMEKNLVNDTIKAVKRLIIQRIVDNKTFVPNGK